MTLFGPWPSALGIAVLHGDELGGVDPEGAGGFADRRGPHVAVAVLDAPDGRVTDARLLAQFPQGERPEVAQVPQPFHVDLHDRQCSNSFIIPYFIRYLYEMNTKPSRHETLHLVYVGDEPLREIPARC